MVNLASGYRLVPNILYIELKCYMPRPGYREPQVLCFVPRGATIKHVDGDRYRFEPIPDKIPEWIIPDGFVPGSFFMEGFDMERGGDLFFTWELAGQEDYRPGERVNLRTCTAPLPS